MLPAAGWDAAEVLRLAASLERGSRAPAGGGDRARGRGARHRLAKAEDFEAVTGMGVRGG